MFARYLSSWFIVLFKSSIALLILFLVLSITESKGLKSLTIIVELSVSSFSSVIFCFMYLGLCCWVQRCVYNYYILRMNWPCYHHKMSFLTFKSILSDISIDTPAFLWLPFAWYIFVYLFISSLFVSLNLQCVCCSQHMFKSCFVFCYPVQPSFLCDWIVKPIHIYCCIE